MCLSTQSVNIRDGLGFLEEAALPCSECSIWFHAEVGWSPAKTCNRPAEIYEDSRRVGYRVAFILRLRRHFGAKRSEGRPTLFSPGVLCCGQTDEFRAEFRPEIVLIGRKVRDFSVFVETHTFDQ